MIGLYFGMIILGFILGFIVTASIVFYSVKNKATIIKVQLLGDNLDESTTLLFAVRRNIAAKITYRCPSTINEGIRAFARKKHWQQQHQIRIIGKPVRASCIKIDDKIISVLHYVAIKIEFVEDCIDSMIIHAYEDSELALATIGAANNINETTNKKKKPETEVKVVKDYLAFIKNSIADLNNQVITERQKRVYLSEQFIPAAQLIASEFLEVDLEAICKSAKLPALDKILMLFAQDPSPKSEGSKKLKQLQKKVDETVKSATS